MDMETAINAATQPTIPKNHDKPRECSPDTETFIPNKPVTRWHGTKTVARIVILLKPELMVKLIRRLVALIWAK